MYECSNGTAGFLGRRTRCAYTTEDKTGILQLGTPLISLVGTYGYPESIYSLH